MEFIGYWTFPDDWDIDVYCTLCGSTKQVVLDTDFRFVCLECLIELYIGGFYDNEH